MDTPDPVDRVSSKPLRAMLRMFGFSPLQVLPLSIPGGVT
jgi:hypothetical protein